LKAFKSEMTIGMSAPPMGITKRMPRTSAAPKVIYRETRSDRNGTPKASAQRPS
jgi:hypothetical protein